MAFNLGIENFLGGIMVSITQYNKTLVAIAGVIAITIAQTITDEKWAAIAGAVAIALGVYSVPNKKI